MRSLAFVAVAAFLALQATADEPSLSPYIDSIKQGWEKDRQSQPAGSDTPYLDSVRERMKKEGEKEGQGAPAEGYTEYIRETSPTRPRPGQLEESYTEREKRRLEEEDKVKRGELPASAIQAVREGNSELHPVRPGEISHAWGLRYGVSLDRNIVGDADTQLQPFSSIYQSYAPDIELYWEYQPWHSEWWGNIGIYASLGVSFFKGDGVYKFQLTNPVTNQPFPPTSTTKFGFFELPLSLGLDYRFNLFRVLRPFVIAAPMLIGYTETRSDGIGGGCKPPILGANCGVSTALFVSGGVALLLDWITPGSMDSLYQTFGVKHYYLTAEYMRVQPISTSVSFAISGVTLGLTYEY